MHSRRHVFPVLGLVASLVMPASASGQGTPPSIGTDVTSAVELSADQVARVKAYVTQWAGVLNAESSKPSEVEAARDRLVGPLSQPGGTRLVSPNFRGTYSSAVLPELEKTLSGNNIYRSINALRVASVLGTDRAANFLANNADGRAQPSWEIRLRAADGLRLLFQSGALDARKTIDAARRLREASIREENWMVVRTHLEALHEADGSTLAAADRSTIRGLIGEAMSSAAQRVADSSEPSKQMLLAMGSAMGTLRLRVTQYGSSDQRAIGSKLGPSIGSLLDWSRTHWEKIKEDRQADQFAVLMVASSEGVLQIIDPVLVERRRPTPTSDMRNAWARSDKPTFETGVAAWQGVLGSPPYRQ